MWQPVGTVRVTCLQGTASFCTLGLALILLPIASTGCLSPRDSSKGPAQDPVALHERDKSNQSDVEDYIRKLSSDDPGTREDAFQRLEGIGDRGRERLEQILRGSDTDLKALTTTLLRAMEVRRTISKNVLSIRPGVCRRLVEQGEHAWTQTFLELSEDFYRKPRKYPVLRCADLEPLAANALVGAESEEEAQTVANRISHLSLASGAPALLEEALGRDRRNWTPVILREHCIKLLVDMNVTVTQGQLRTLLGDGNSDIRAGAATLLGSAPFAGEMQDQMRTLLRDSAQDVRSATLICIGKQGAEGLLPDVFAALQDEKYSVRVSAGIALSHFRLDADSVRKILPLLGHKDHTVRQSSILAMVRTRRAEAATALLEVLERGDPDHRNDLVLVPAIVHLSVSGTADRLAKILQSADGRIRKSALVALGNIGAKSHCQSVIPFLRDERDTIRTAAINAAGALACKDAVPILLELIEDQSEAVSRNALLAASILGDPAVVGQRISARLPKADVPTLIAAGFTRREDLTDALVPYLGSHRLMRAAAVFAVSRTCSEAQFPKIVALMKHEEPLVRASALEVAMWRGGRTASAEILLRLGDSNAEVRKAALRALANLDPIAAGKEVSALLGDTDPLTREEAARIAGQLKLRDATAILKQLLLDEHDSVRAAAAGSLCELELGDGVDELLELSRYRSIPLAQLNAFRSPKEWELLRSRSWDLTAYVSAKDVHSIVESQSGLRILGKSWAFSASLDSGSWARSPPLAVDQPRFRLLELLQLIVDEDEEWVLEKDSIQVLKRRDAVRFWQGWWLAYQRK